MDSVILGEKVDSDCWPCHVERQRWTRRKTAAINRRKKFEQQHAHDHARPDQETFDKWGQLLAKEWLARLGFELWSEHNEREAARQLAEQTSSSENGYGSFDYYASLQKTLQKRHAHLMPVLGLGPEDPYERVSREMEADHI